MSQFGGISLLLISIFVYVQGSYISSKAFPSKIVFPQKKFYGKQVLHPSKIYKHEPIILSSKSSFGGGIFSQSKGFPMKKTISNNFYSPSIKKGSGYQPSYKGIQRKKMPIRYYRMSKKSYPMLKKMNTFQKYRPMMKGSFGGYKKGVPSKRIVYRKKQGFRPSLKKRPQFPGKKQLRTRMNKNAWIHSSSKLGRGGPGSRQIQGGGISIGGGPRGMRVNSDMNVDLRGPEFGVGVEGPDMGLGVGGPGGIGGIDIGMGGTGGGIDLGMPSMDMSMGGGIGGGVGGGVGGGLDLGAGIGGPGGIDFGMGMDMGMNNGGGIDFGMNGLGGNGDFGMNGMDFGMGGAGGLDMGMTVQAPTEITSSVMITDADSVVHSSANTNTASSSAAGAIQANFGHISDADHVNLNQQNLGGGFGNSGFSNGDALGIDLGVLSSLGGAGAALDLVGGGGGMSGGGAGVGGATDPFGAGGFSGGAGGADLFGHGGAGGAGAADIFGNGGGVGGAGAADLFGAGGGAGGVAGGDIFGAGAGGGGGGAGGDLFGQAGVGGGAGADLFGTGGGAGGHTGQDPFGSMFGMGGHDAVATAASHQGQQGMVVGKPVALVSLDGPGQGFGHGGHGAGHGSISGQGTGKSAHSGVSSSAGSHGSSHSTGHI